MVQPILSIRALRVSFIAGEREIEAVKNVEFDIFPGETVAIVGESGSGKSVTARSIMRLLPSPPSFIKDGSIRWKGEELIQASEKRLEQVRGKEISMIFQDPMSSLNPTTRIGDQLAESLIKHQKLSKKEALEQSVILMEQVGITNARQRAVQYPHEFSGGMRQRAMIAMALACEPQLLLADEPTTALDVTIQAQILALMKTMQQRLGTAIVLITHDLGVVAGMCDRVIVMEKGEIVETGTTEDIFYHAKHPYTQKLLNALPKLHEPKQPKPLSTTNGVQDVTTPLIEVRSLVKEFDLGRGERLKAVNDISFSIYPGETLGLVGESGSGKSTTGRTLLQLHQATSGDVLFDGIPLNRLTKNQLKQMRRRIQIIFQDPYASLNPRQKIVDIIGTALDLHGLAKNRSHRQQRVEELLELVGLEKSHAMRYPHEFSGGQRQRIGIARALAVEPDFIVCDEPLSALDVSIQKQIVDLLRDLQQKFNLTFLFIAHDLSMVKHISDRVAVMYKGKIVELAESEQLYTFPQHAYTKALLASIPIPDPHVEVERLENRSARLRQETTEVYDVEDSILTEVSPNHWVAVQQQLTYQ
ncbi:dipeptide ABC transporter ATP-binding protein [Chryseomicrobium palamuruense]|uniref:Dipeptide ABC transporter ATP-binding protein n=1 Tax=Chryseomicrobium palamuruense TaxID=682973 RepID=A0ABV8UXL4_9BACL